MRIYYFIITLIISFCVSLQAQNNADKFKQQAQSSFENKDYTKARYLYIQAYKDYANEGKITQAIECGTQAASLYHRENYYQEAFDLCRQMSQIVANQEHAEQKKLYGLRFGITKERLQMYIKLRNTAQAQLQLNMLDNLAEESGNPELTEELLYTKTDYFYIFEQKKEGDAAFNKLISQYREKKEYGKIDECYQNLIAIARKANNISLLEQTYEKYMVWTDSVKMLTAEVFNMIFNIKYEKRVVCFIDILGFSNIIKKTTRVTDGINFDLQNIVNALDFVHNHFSELSLDYEGLIQLSQFSDSIVISF